MKFSIIIPCFNEGKNIILLIQEIFEVLKKKIEFELIIVDDNSNFFTKNLLLKLKNEYPFLLLENSLNKGQSFSIYRGVQVAKYSNIITLDGDGQNDPSDIFALLNIYINSGYGLVGGIRKKRKDSLLKILSSKIANLIRSFILKDNCPDTGCGLKIFKKYKFLELEYFDGIHRFLPALFTALGERTDYIFVNHRYRIYGHSNYGTLDRGLKGIKDLFRVKIIVNKLRRHV